MLVESAIANIATPGQELPGDKTDWLDLTWLDCKTRFARKITRSGQEIRLLLRLGQSLRHGDILGTWPDGKSVVVNLLPADVLIIRPGDLSQWVTAVFQIGNLHLPIETGPDYLLIPSSSEAEATLAKAGIIFQSLKSQFQPTHWPQSVQLSPDLRIIRRKAGN